MQISTAAEFIAMRNGEYPNETEFVLINDINLSNSDMSVSMAALEDASLDGGIYDQSTGELTGAYVISGVKASPAGAWNFLNFGNGIKNVRINGIDVNGTGAVNVLYSYSSTVRNSRIVRASVTHINIRSTDTAYMSSICYAKYGIYDVYLQGWITANRVTPLYVLSPGLPQDSSVGYRGSIAGCMTNLRIVRYTKNQRPATVWDSGNSGTRVGCAINNAYSAMTQMYDEGGGVGGYSASRAAYSSDIDTTNTKFYTSYNDKGFYNAERITATDKQSRGVTLSLTGTALTTARAKDLDPDPEADPPWVSIQNNLYWYFSNSIVREEGASYESSIRHGTFSESVRYHMVSRGTFYGLTGATTVQSVEAGQNYSIDVIFTLMRARNGTRKRITKNKSGTATATGIQSIGTITLDSLQGEDMYFEPGDTITVSTASTIGVKWGNDYVNTGVLKFAPLDGGYENYDFASGLMTSGMTMWAIDPDGIINEGYPYIAYLWDVSTIPNNNFFYKENDRLIPCRLAVKGENGFTYTTLKRKE